MARKEILVVEDEALIGFDLADLLETAGYSVRGPFATASAALSAMVGVAVPLNLAILDVSLGEGQTSEPVAEAMLQTGTPIIFVSGYNSSGSDVLRRFPTAERMSKPWDPQELLRTVARHVDPAPGLDRAGGDLSPTLA